MTLTRTDLPEKADAELLALARSGDSEAFAVVYERHVAAARQLAYQLAATPRLADELVADAFGRMLDVVTRGGGPSCAVRPYVLTAVRQLSYEALHGANGQPPAGGAPLPGSDQLLIDPAVAGLETALIARAYQALPERSRAVLWHTEIEQDSAADIAHLLGLTRNGIAGLRRRAADDLRQAYIQMHVSLITQPGCRPVAERLGAFDRRTLSARDAALVSEHLARCEGCQVVHRELTDLVTSLRGVIAPLILGPAAAGYLAGAGHRMAAATVGTQGPASASVLTGASSGRGGSGASSGEGSRAGRDGGSGSLAPVGGEMAPLPAAETALLPGPDQLRHSPHGHRRSLRNSLRLPPRGTRRSRRVAVAAAVGVVLTVAAATALAVTLTGKDNAPASARQLAAPPSRQASAAQPPTASLSPSPQPSPSPSSPSPAAPAVPIQLTASLSVWTHGASAHPDEIVFQVTNTGSAVSGPLTAVIALPAGSSLVSGSSGFGGNQQGGGSLDGSALPLAGGWSCQPTTGGAICTHAALSAGQQSQGTLFITVTDSGACGQPVRLTVTGGTTVGASEAIRC